MNELSFPPISHYMDPRLGFNMVAKGGALRCTWIAKNMCTSLKFAFAEGEGILKPDLLQQFVENPHWIHNWIWPLEAKGPLQLNIPQTSFFVLRDPVARLASALLEKLIYQDDDYQRIVVPAMEFFSGYVQRPAEDLTFGDFLQFVEWSPDRTLDQHFMAQTTVLSGHYTHCFQFEKPQLVADFLAGHGLTLRKIRPHSHDPSGTDLSIGLESKITAVRRAYRATPEVWFTPDAAMRSRIEELVQTRFRTDLALWSLARLKGGCIER